LFSKEKTEKKKAGIKRAVKDTAGYKSRRAAGPLCACRIRRTLSWLPFYPFRMKTLISKKLIIFDLKKIPEAETNGSALLSKLKGFATGSQEKTFFSIGFLQFNYFGFNLTLFD